MATPSEIWSEEDGGDVKERVEKLESDVASIREDETQAAWFVWLLAMLEGERQRILGVRS